MTHDTWKVAILQSGGIGFPDPISGKVQLRLVRRILEAGPRIAAYRGWQSARLATLRARGYWQALEGRVARFWDEATVGRWVALARADRFLIGRASREAFEAWSATHADWRRATAAQAQEIRRGEIRLFDAPHRFKFEEMPWEADWRWAHRWPRRYYRTYRFAVGQKPRPYDVKFPWELSRFTFLLPLLQASIIERDHGSGSRARALLEDWERSNPAAYSVNWVPMEVSMRGLALAMAVQVAVADTGLPPGDATPFLRQLALHGEFLARNLEFTDVRDNHYVANLAALLWLGFLLRDLYPSGEGWFDTAARGLGPEVLQYFCADGVGFEKSTAYHRLVTELFLVSSLVLDRAGRPLSSDARGRLRDACAYTGCYLQPDGNAPLVGDNDSARVLHFDPVVTRDHRPLLALAAAYFGDPWLKRADDHGSAAVPWLLGPAGVERWEALPARGSEPFTRFFPAGGMMASGEGGHHLVADFGEVGLRGRGGHGHNDTFSFVLSLGGRPVVVDPGSPVYTGDLGTYDRFRSTPFHNTIVVDGEEMARPAGVFRIADEAAPTGVAFTGGEECDIVEGEHRGFTRLVDPVTHRRRLAFHRRAGRLECTDVLRCARRHRVQRFLHFAPGLDPKLTADGLEVDLGEGMRVLVTWTEPSHPSLATGQVSESYGQVEDAPVLTLENDIDGDAELRLAIALEAAVSGRPGAASAVQARA